MTTDSQHIAVRFAGRRCLVTGGLGFIGSNLTIALVRAGASVTVVDALIPTHGGAECNLPIEIRESVDVQRTMIDDPTLAAVIADSEVIFNLAGQVSHVDSMVDPLKDLYLNGQSQIGFLELVRQHQPTAKIVYSSTRQVYGRAMTPLVTELHPTNPLDINGISKLAADHAHRVYAVAHGLDTTILRLTNTYGPRLRLTTDRQGFLAVFIKQALLGETISLYGDGQQRRDCLYIDDAVDAILRAGSTATPRGTVFNLGNDRSASLREIADLLVGITGRGSVVTSPWPADRERIDVGSVAVSSAVAHRDLGWDAGITLPDGLKRTIEFFENSGGRTWLAEQIKLVPR